MCPSCHVSVTIVAIIDYYIAEKSNLFHTQQQYNINGKFKTFVFLVIFPTLLLKESPSYHVFDYIVFCNVPWHLKNIYTLNDFIGLVNEQRSQ